MMVVSCTMQMPPFMTMHSVNVTTFMPVTPFHSVMTLMPVRSTHFRMVSFAALITFFGSMGGGCLLG